MDAHQRLNLINEKLQSIQEIDIPGAETFADMKQTYQTVKDSLPLIKAGLKGAAIAGPAGLAAGFAGRKALKYTVGKPLAGVAKLGLYGAAKGAQAGARLGLKGAKVGGRIAKRVATRINDTLLTGRDRKFKQNVQDPVVRTTGKALSTARKGLSKVAAAGAKAAGRVLRDGVEYEVQESNMDAYERLNAINEALLVLEDRPLITLPKALGGRGLGRSKLARLYQTLSATQKRGTPDSRIPTMSAKGTVRPEHRSGAYEKGTGRDGLDSTIAKRAGAKARGFLASVKPVVDPGPSRTPKQRLTQMRLMHRRRGHDLERNILNLNPELYMDPPGPGIKEPTMTKKQYLFPKSGEPNPAAFRPTRTADPRRQAKNPTQLEKERDARRLDIARGRSVKKSGLKPDSKFQGLRPSENPYRQSTLERQKAQYQRLQSLTPQELDQAEAKAMTRDIRNRRPGELLNPNKEVFRQVRATGEERRALKREDDRVKADYISRGINPAMSPEAQKEFAANLKRSKEMRKAAGINLDK